MADKTPNRGIKRIVKDITRVQERVSETEKPSGSQYARLVEQVETKLGQIDQAVSDAIAANSYTQSQIDSKFSIANQNLLDGLNGRASVNHSHDQGDISGTWTKGVNTGSGVTGGSILSNGDLRATTLYATGAPGYAMTTTRVAAWWQSSDGRAGTASSSQRFKTNIRDLDDVDPQIVLEMMPQYYSYIEQVELAEKKRAGEVPYRYEPNAHAAQELGMIAEQLRNLGLWQAVIWERDTDDKLILDEEGDPIPFGIHYHLIAVLQQHALQWLNRRISAIEDHLGLAPVK